jgi:hypothetical protein
MPAVSWSPVTARYAPLSSANTATAKASMRAAHFIAAIRRAMPSCSAENSSTASAPSSVASGATTFRTARAPPAPERLASAASFTASVPISATINR